MSKNKWVGGVCVDQVNVKDLRSESVDKGYKPELDKTLPSAFIRLENQQFMEHDAKTYIGLGYVERMPDYWELFSTAHGNPGTVNSFNGIDTENLAA